MSLFVDTVSWLLMTAGGVFVLIGGIGVLRMPELYTRLHASSLTDTMGSLLVLLGLMLQSGFALATFKLFAILVFLLFTAPTASYALVNTALLSGVRPRMAEAAAEAARAAEAAGADEAGKAADEEERP